MTELRRLLINTSRLTFVSPEKRSLLLNRGEIHYLKRVLRLRTLDRINVVDGRGHLWEAALYSSDSIQFLSPIENPLIFKQKKHPSICISVVVPKQGFEDIIRMCCEIGVDFIQPISSERSVTSRISDQRFSRWRSIVKEAVEQSERLWEPELKNIITFSDWLRTLNSSSLNAIASPRKKKSKAIEQWLHDIPMTTSPIWLAIGPEGGWSEEEVQLALKRGFTQVDLGETILKTSTAAIASSQLLISWRRTSCFQ